MHRFPPSLWKGGRGVRAGFTLIEILVAFALGAVLLLLAAQVFHAGLQSRERLRAYSADVSALRQAFETMSRDFHSAVVPPVDSGVQFGLAANPAGPGSSVLQFASVVGEPLFAGRTANETVLVQYVIADDPRANPPRPTLWRYATPYPAPDTSGGAATDDARPLALLPGVVAASYTFYDPTQQTWVESWDGQPGLPTAIRVELAIQSADGKGNPTQESWVFSMPAAKYANDEAAAQSDAAAGTGTGTTSGTGSAGSGSRTTGQGTTGRTSGPGTGSGSTR